MIICICVHLMPPLFVVVVHPGERDSLTNQVQLCQVFNQFIYHLRTRYLFTLSLSLWSPSHPCCSRLVGEVPFPHPLHTFHPPNKLRHLGFRGKEILWKGEAIYLISIVTEYRIRSFGFVVPKKVDITSYFLFRVFWFIGLCVFSLSLKIPPSRHFKL